MTVKILDHVSYSPLELTQALNAKFDLGRKRFIYRRSEPHPTLQDHVTVFISVQASVSNFVEGAELQHIAQLVAQNPVSTAHFEVAQTRAPRTVVEHLQADSPSAIFLLIINTFGLVFTIVTMALFYMHRSHKRIRITLPVVSGIMMASLCMIHIGVYLYIGMPTSSLCGAREALVDVGFSLFFR
jgi:hypothetical protein